MWALGIDPAVNGLGLVVINSTGKCHARWLARGSTGKDIPARMDRYDDLIGRTLDFMQQFPPTVCCIENYAYSKVSTTLIEFGGLLRWELVAWQRAHGMILREIAINTLKLFATGNGQANKTQIVAKLTARYGVQFDHDDCYDAYALSRMSHILAGFSKEETDFQRRAMFTVTNGAPRKRRKGSK